MTGPRTEDDDTLMMDGTPPGDGDSAGEASAVPREVLVEGTTVSRYIVLERLGEGGMGVVLRAYDPKLRREVALKVMRRSTGFDGPEAQARMLREAQALARLNNPHVVAVYDAESTEFGVCIAMEYVEGRTLRAWLREKSRRWPVVLEVVLAAARGLAAAHAAGIVHRDIKPANVLVGTDGRVRLTDFGLARERERRDDRLSVEPTSVEPDDGHSRDSLSELTELGMILGTPAYMAPEQHERGTADTRSDQYALCVVLWEALYGATKALVEAKQRAHLRRPSSSVPDWVHTAIVRGLAAAPEKRWPSVDALVDALALGQSRTRRRRVFAGFGLATCVALGGVSWQQWDRSRHVAACERAGESIAEVWNDDIREGLRSALVGTGVSHAEETADKVMPWFDGQAQDWQTAQTETCLAAEVHDTWDADLLDRGLWCLEERRMEFEALVTELSSGEAKSVEAAVPAAAGLRQVGPCRDGDLLRRRSSPPKERRDEIRSVRAELSRATALQQTGAYDEGLALVRDALSRAESLKWPPLIAEAYFGLGALLESTGDYEGATETLEAAYFGATKAGGAPEVAVAAAVQLVYVVGYRLARNEEGLRWSRHAEVALASAPALAPIRKATLLGNLANLDHAKGAYENAKTLYERALAIRETALGPEHPQVATILNNLAAAHRATGANAEAKALYEHGLAILENALGPEHPMVATILSNLGNVYASMGSFEEAKALHGRALVIQEKALGPEHSDLASSLNNLASVHHDIGENEEAKTLYERALVIQEKALGPEHPRVATSLNNLANVQHDIGADETAKTLHERALAIREQALGPEHPDVASSLENLAEVHHATGAHEEAKSLYERALAIREQALGSEHPSVTNALIGLGNVALAQHRAGDGVLLVERAVRLREATRARTIDIAETRFLLGQTLWAANRERPRAVDLAEQARDAYQDAGATELADVEAWLAIHEGSQ